MPSASFATTSDPPLRPLHRGARVATMAPGAPAPSHDGLTETIPAPRALGGVHSGQEARPCEFSSQASRSTSAPKQFSIRSRSRSARARASASWGPTAWASRRCSGSSPESSNRMRERSFVCPRPCRSATWHRSGRPPAGRRCSRLSPGRRASRPRSASCSKRQERLLSAREGRSGTPPRWRRSSRSAAATSRPALARPAPSSG